jgi:hypothetical protein
MWKRRSWSGVEGSMTPRDGLLGATFGEIGALGWGVRRTMGLAGLVRRVCSSGERMQRAAAFAASATMAASQASWYPPRALRATIPPVRRRFATVSRMGLVPWIGSGLPQGSVSERWGPQVGQAMGWAWKRRFVGSTYSARQAGHMGKLAMVVWARS